MISARELLKWAHGWVEDEAWQALVGGIEERRPETAGMAVGAAPLELGYGRRRKKKKASRGRQHVGIRKARDGNCSPTQMRSPAPALDAQTPRCVPCTADWWRNPVALDFKTGGTGFSRIQTNLSQFYIFFITVPVRPVRLSQIKFLTIF